MKASGVHAKKRGTKLKRGAALQVVCYPRPRTKAVLVEAARKAERALSSFMVHASLKEAAEILRREVVDLIPREELNQYFFTKKQAGKKSRVRTPFEEMR